LAAALAAAQATYRQARDAFTATDDRAGTAQRAVNAATRAAERATTTVEALRTRIADLTDALAQAPGAAEATEQIRLIDEMTAAVRDAAAAVDVAVADRSAAHDQLSALSVRVGQAWRELRSARDTVLGFGAPDLPDGSVFVGWTTLATWAGAAVRSRAAAMPDAQDEVASAARRRDAVVDRLAAEFATLGLDLAGDPADTAAPVVAAALTQAVADRTRIAERRARAATLQADLAAAQQDQQVARELGRLLRSNMFPEWLEAAALDTLVVDASTRLSDLSGGQFELTHRDGEFMVVDHADADSIRSVRTLSGGETFQASLALALALSTQLSSMAAEGAARLDSIFLDEGFGTLDEATLEVVAATLENLAHGDRMVGVVTHVGALADRIPVRFRVRRDSRTSSIEREAL
jgi:exonuclease SbcC